MLLRPVMMIVSAAVMCALSTAPAEAKKKRAPKRSVAPQAVPARGYEPARMIQVRPGVFISSYGCYTDAGYGRIAPCDLSSPDN